MRFRIIFHHFRSWEQLHFHAMAVIAAVDYAYLLAIYREEEKERHGRLELQQYLRRDTLTSMRKEIKARLKAHEELEKLHQATARR